MAPVRLDFDEHDLPFRRNKRDNIQFAPPVATAGTRVPFHDAPSQPAEMFRGDILAPTPSLHASVRAWGPDALFAAEQLFQQSLKHHPSPIFSPE